MTIERFESDINEEISNRYWEDRPEIEVTRNSEGADIRLTGVVDVARLPEVLRKDAELVAVNGFASAVEVWTVVVRENELHSIDCAAVYGPWKG